MLYHNKLDDWVNILADKFLVVCHVYVLTRGDINTYKQDSDIPQLLYHSNDNVLHAMYFVNL